MKGANRKGTFLAIAVALGAVALAMIAPGAGSAAAKPKGGHRHHPVKPKSPKGQKRVYEMVFDGGFNEAYTASDSTAFDIQRAGLVGCDFHQHGDFLVFWRSVWRISATVHPRSGHISIDDVGRTAGPANPKEPGDSEIDGANSNEGAGSQCSEEELAGTYECNAEALVPSDHFEPEFAPDPDKPRAFLLKVPGFATATASYSGKAPANYGCAESVGSDAIPGGFIGIDLAGADGDAVWQLNHLDLARLKKKKKVEDQDVALPEDRDWSISAIPKKGSSCALREEESHETCIYDEANRAAELFIRRVR